MPVECVVWICLAALMGLGIGAWASYKVVRHQDRLNLNSAQHRAAEIVKKAASSGRSLREIAREEGVDEAILDEALDYRAMAKPYR